jgi:hypothetical protein
MTYFFEFSNSVLKPDNQHRLVLVESKTGEDDLKTANHQPKGSSRNLLLVGLSLFRIYDSLLFVVAIWCDIFR